MSEISVVKFGGRRELFGGFKLRRSLLKAGASPEVADKVLEQAEKQIVSGMTTDEIYRRAFSILWHLARPAAVRYSLRRAISDFGPTGFPFEDFVAELFRSLGFEAKTRVILQGACVAHEVDVVAWNGEKLIMVEAKFHNSPGERTDQKVTLYVKARFDDLIEQVFQIGGRRRELTEGWLITNTKFTLNAVRYGLCAGLKLLSWDYPEKDNLHRLIEEARLHPVTSLSSLSLAEKQRLLENGVVLCRTILELGADKLRRYGIPEAKVKPAVEEASLICRGG